MSISIPVMKIVVVAIINVEMKRYVVKEYVLLNVVMDLKIATTNV